MAASGSSPAPTARRISSWSRAPRTIARRGLTAFLYHRDQPGWRIVRRIGILGPEEHGGHCELEFDGLEVEDENVLLDVGDGLRVTQIRLGPARLTHCMRWLGQAKICSFPQAVAMSMTAATGRESDRSAPRLSDLPPTAFQTWSAVAVAAFVLVAFIAIAPFSGMPLGALNIFFPLLDAIVFVTDLVTAVLLFSQFAISGSRPLLALANGYLFTGLIVVPHALTFTGAFSPTGLLGANIQTGSWLFIFWHIGFAASLAGLRPALHRQPRATTLAGARAIRNSLERGGCDRLDLRPDMARHRRERISCRPSSWTPTGSALWWSIRSGSRS